ncbi:sulfotransferase family 1, cytosolic sulfotransferase 5 [Denticeps clupeoides]|uniref:Sulfotransferase n=1 Tax=Denticeps clupeoides TaxID=299321 RepID=A0AAY4EGP8_9TELE|nr:sulfotransferase 1C4-like [Denticeps clupeoides]
MEKLETRCPLVDLNGIPMLKQVVTHFHRVETFQPFPEDLLISTYPKAGTTWTQEIVDLILHHDDFEKCKRAPIHVRVPFLEMNSADPAFSGTCLLEKMDPPRVIKTHLPLQLIPQSFWDAGCKVIYVARNPKDNAVSYFHFDRMNLVQPDPGSWSQYLDKFMNGEVSWGSWYDHVKGYWKERDKKKILYLFFEDMKEDPGHEVKQIAKFLGYNLSQRMIEEIVQRTTFESMRDNPMANYSDVPENIFNRQASEFMRKGEVGDWENHFSPEQNATFDEHYKKMMADLPIPFRFVI